MDMVLWWIAGISTFFFVGRLVLLMMGFDGGVADAADASDAISAADAADAADFKVFTFLGLLVLFMFGSWTALLMSSMGQNEWISLGVGSGVGIVAMIGVGYLLGSIKKLEHDGTVRDFKARGMKGECYVRIPEVGEGKGQVKLVINGRETLFDAVSDGPAIESFTEIVVMDRVDDETVRVCPTA